MTKNEKMMFLELTRLSGHLSQALTEVLGVLPEDSEASFKEQMEKAIKSFENITDLMIKEWNI